jgi:hypothetical protein
VHAPPALARLWRRSLVAGALAGLLGLVGWQAEQAVEAFAAAARLWLPYPYPRPGSEGLMLYETLAMRQGVDLYGPITPDHFISGPYPPVYYWLAGRVMPAAPGFFDGRSLSMWAALAVAALTVVLILAEAWRPSEGRRAGGVGGLLGGLLAVGLWLAAPPVQIWATRFRADMLMMAFMAGGLACVAAGAPPGPMSAVGPVRRAALLGLGAALFVLALFTKQTAIAGPLAAAAYLAVRDRRLALWWTLGAGALGALVFVALDVATGHGFYLKMVVYHSLPWSGATFTRLLGAWQEDHLALILLALAYGAWLLATRRNSLIGWYLLATLLTLPTAGVVGADHNHLLPVDLALALAGGGALATAGARLLAGGPGASDPAPGRRAPGAALGAVAVACGAYFAMVAAPAAWYGPDLAMPDAAVQDQLRQIVALVRDSPPGVYLADDPGLLALAGKSTDYDDLFTVTALAASGRWDASALEDRLRRGAFPLVLLNGDVSQPPRRPLRGDILTPAMREALRQGYQRLYADVYFTFAPRP